MRPPRSPSPCIRTRCHFYKRGKGRYQAAPEENLKAALAGMEKKRRQQLQVDEWAAELGAKRVPAPLAEKLDTLLFKPDKLSLEWRALDQAPPRRGPGPAAPARRGGRARRPRGLLPAPLRLRVLPAGPGFPAATGSCCRFPELPLAATPAFSIDDEETTEIDDAFSLARDADGNWIVGVHIAAPALAFDRASPLEAIARERLSTVYFPGGKITMLPGEAVARATLAAGTTCRWPRSTSPSIPRAWK
jgi:exoribonuclease-2